MLIDWCNSTLFLGLVRAQCVLVCGIPWLERGCGTGVRSRQRYIRRSWMLWLGAICLHVYSARKTIAASVLTTFNVMITGDVGNRLEKWRSALYPWNTSHVVNVCPCRWFDLNWAQVKIRVRRNTCSLSHSSAWKISVPSLCGQCLH